MKYKIVKREGFHHILNQINNAVSLIPEDTRIIHGIFASFIDIFQFILNREFTIDNSHVYFDNSKRPYEVIIELESLDKEYLKENFPHLCIL